MREVKYAVVTMAFRVDETPTRPCFLTIWPNGLVELNAERRQEHGAARIVYRWREVRDADCPEDVAGEALALVLGMADSLEYKPGDFEHLRAWHQARVHQCEHGHNPADCSQCVLQYSLPEEE